MGVTLYGDEHGKVLKTFAKPFLDSHIPRGKNQWNSGSDSPIESPQSWALARAQPVPQSAHDLSIIFYLTL